MTTPAPASFVQNSKTTSPNASHPLENFFIVGALKCGTTAWAHYLSRHPDIFFPTAKEPHYFNTDQPNFRRVKNDEEYSQHFKDCHSEKIISEASVQYLYSSTAARSNFEYNPAARILIMLRKPSAFIRSYHNQLLMNCDETIENLRLAWELSDNRSEGDVPPQNRDPSFLNYKKVGLFSEQIARYFEHFDRSQIVVVFMENWTKAPRKLYLDLMKFLDTADDGQATFPLVHAAKTVSSRSLHRITQRPPSALKTVGKLVRRVPGLQSFRAGSFLRKMNVRQGYRASEFDAALANEIDAYFAEDQERLRQMLAR